MTNAFEQMAEAQIAAPVKRRMAQADDRARKKAERLASMTESDKREEEAATLFRQYKAWKRERLQEHLQGELGPLIRPLISFLRRMTLEDGPALLEMLEKADWLRQADRQVRIVVLDAVASAISRIRVNAFMPPMDDALPGEPPTFYQAAKPLITGEDWT